MQHLRRHRRALEFALLTLAAYVAALGLSAAVANRVARLPAPPDAGEADTSPPPATEPLAAYAVIAERDVFNPGHAGARHDAAPASLRLWGVALRGGEARAVIEDLRTRKQDLYRVGDDVGGARIAAIDWDRVTLDRRGGEETLEMATPATAPDAPGEMPAPPEGRRQVADADEHIRRTAENAFIVDRRELTGAVDNMSGLLTQLRAVAEVEDGRPAGFRLFQIRGGSLFARLGLQNGDVVQRVNGTAVQDPATLLAFIQRLRTEPRVALDIVRGGAPRTLVYDLR